MFTLGSLLLLGWLAFGCGALGQSQAARRAATAEPVVTLSRGPDYSGQIAPVYRLEIYADGAVVFTGEKNVKTVGVARGRISQKQLRELMEEFEKASYFSLRDNYDGRGGCPYYLADGPAASTAVVLDGRRKSVLHDSGCYADEKTLAPFPEGLDRLEHLIDATAGSRRWVE